VSSYWCCCCIVRVLLIVCVLILEGLCTIRFMWYLCGKLTCDPLLSSFDCFGSSSSFFFMWLDVIFYVVMLLITSVILFFLLLDLVRLLLSSSCWLDVIFYVVMLLKLVFVPLLSSFFFIFWWWVCRFEKSYCICVEMSFTYPKCLRYPDFAPRVLRGTSFRLLIFHQESCGSFPGVACTL
jgi:hypothetical protein